MTADAANIQERALLLALIEFAPNIEPSTTRLAQMLGTSERHVRRLLRGLESRGLVTVELRPGRRSRYTLHLPDPGPIVPPDQLSPRTDSPPTPDQLSSPPRTIGPPKQTTKADKEADKDHSPFRLAAPERPSKGRKRTATTDPSAHKVVVDFYFQAFEDRHARKPVFDGAEGKAVERLLDKLGGDASEACRRIRIAFGSWKGASVTIRDIATKPDAFASAEPPRNGRGAPIVQRGGTIREGDTSWLDDRGPDGNHGYGSPEEWG